jgi:hypothetical protein
MFVKGNSKSLVTDVNTYSARGFHLTFYLIFFGWVNKLLRRKYDVKTQEAGEANMKKKKKTN